MKITVKVQNFIDAVVDGVSLTQAYEQSFDCSRMKRTTIGRRGHDLAKDADVAAEIKRRRDEAAERSIKNVADVTNEFLRVAFADPGRIVQHRRLNCRYCYGVKFAYQWKDQNEFNEAVRIHDEAEMERKAARGPKKRARKPPTDEGGYGFAFNAAPNPACPHCMGEGHADLFVADTTQLTPEERRLIKRIKVTKDGLDIQLRDQSDALTKAGQMLGGFKQTVVLQNPDGSAIQNAPTVLTLSPDEATAQYKSWMDGNAEKK